MTSNPLAEARPSPSTRRPPDPSAIPRRQLPGTSVLPAAVRIPHVQENGRDVVEDRPAKRRRIEPEATLDAPSDRRPLPRADGVGIESQPPSPLQPLSPLKDPRIRLAKASDLLPERGQVPVRHGDHGETKTELPDLPRRPWNLYRQAKGREDATGTRARMDIVVPTTPDAMVQPVSAPHLVGNKPAGFFPWTGKHAEDVLNELNVQHGFSERPPNPSEKELNTARVPLRNAFKHKSGVDTLSVLFSLVLDRKNHYGLISSVSTFKPPPRVTLTEAKRKSWISDLANAQVPLRKLSRTIPQGIRGQILLDQCLQNAVPLNRAIWFAKCVGANEIRTLKRKGTTPAVAVGAESKWLREWTINVEQFLEASLTPSGAAPAVWRSNVQYALHLTTRLYLENLVDRDHYLEWILKNFTSASDDQTPFWLLVLHIHLRDLSQYRKKGRRLAESLMRKYEQTKDSKSEAVLVLNHKLRHSIRRLVTSRPTCFLMPDKWPHFVQTLKSCVSVGSPEERAVLDHLVSINERSMGANKLAYLSKPSPQDRVVDLLDSVSTPMDVSRLSESLMAACANYDLLILSCLEWATTRFRCSTARIYLTARLLRRWRRLGLDTDTVILNYIGKCRTGATAFDSNALKHLSAELSRSQTFSLSKYMQWLMARGLPEKGTIEAIPDRSNPDADTSGYQMCQDPTLLLLDVAVAGIGDPLVNLRNSILQRAGFNADLEDQITRSCIRHLEYELARFSPNRLSSSSRPRDPPPNFAHLHWSVRSEVGLWLRAHVLEHVRLTCAGINGSPTLPYAPRLACAHFAFVRQVLELMTDESVLADVVGILMSSNEEDLLASLAETVVRHADAFSAIGAFEILQHRLCQNYMAMRAIKATMPRFATSLIGLNTVFPCKVLSVKLLQQDLVRGDRGRAVAACSPFSDGIAESLQQAGATFIEDFEAILQSETNMNEQTMNGLFTVLTERIEKQRSTPDDVHTLFMFCQLLGRLRLFRKAQADVLIHQWILRIIPSLNGDFGKQLLTNLIATGCSSFGSIFDTLHSIKHGSVDRDPAIAALRPLLDSKELDTDDNRYENGSLYNVRTRWWDYVYQAPHSALELLCEAHVTPSDERRLLSRLVFTDSESLLSMSDPARRWLLVTLDQVLRPRPGSSDVLDLKTLVQTVDTLSFRFVQLRIRLMTLSMESQEDHAHHVRDDIVDVFSSFLDQAPSASHGSSVSFSLLLQAVGSDVASRVRHKAEADFLESIPKLLPHKVTSPLPAPSLNDMEQLASSVDRAFQACVPHTNSAPGFIGQLIDKFSQYFKTLGHPGSNKVVTTSAPAASGTPTSAGLSQTVAATSSPMGPPQEPPTVPSMLAAVDHLHFMLQMVCLQRPGICLLQGRPDTNPKVAQQEQVQLLVRLAAIAMHSFFSSSSASFAKEEDQRRVKEVNDFTFDVIATIVDDVSDEVRMMCAKIMKDKLFDERLKPIFGSVNTTGSAQVEDMGQGLVMVKDGKNVIGEWKPRVWEVLENGNGKENETSLGLGLFGARRG